MRPSPGTVVVEFPLRGEWVAVRTPAHRVPSHGTPLLGQRYAFDFVRPDQRRGLRLHPGGTLAAALTGTPTTEFYGWGRPVVAALGGEVVAAVDGVPEPERVHVLGEALRAVRTTRTFAAQRDVAAVAGNHVIVEGAAAYAVFAHLVPGTVTVTTGAAVRVGDLLGRVGHTGNSTAPHLHFHLMDAPDPLQAEGVPCAFAEYLALRRGRWQRVEGGVPERGERIRSVVEEPV